MAFVGPRQGLDGCCNLADDFRQFSYDRVTNDNIFQQKSCRNRVMGFCTEEEYREFLRSCLKYWFSVSDDGQECRLQSRLLDPTKRWNLGPMDQASRKRWMDYSKAKDELFAHRVIKQAPWYMVDGGAKKNERTSTASPMCSA